MSYNPIAEGITSFGNSIGAGLERRNAAIAKRDEEEKQRQIARTVYLATQRGVPHQIAVAGAQGGENADAIIATWESGNQSALMPQKREELDLNLANRAVEDPNASRMNLDMPGAPRMPGSPQMPGPGLNIPRFGPVRPGGIPTTVSGGTELPDPSMRNMMSGIASGNPSMMPNERMDVARNMMRPGDEGLAGVASRSMQMAKTRATTQDEEAKRRFISEFSPDEMYDVPRLAQMGFTEEAAIKYAGRGPVSGREVSRMMYEGQPPAPEKPSKPTWLQQLYHDQAVKQGLKPGTMEYFQFVTKADTTKQDDANKKDRGELLESISRAMITAAEKDGVPFSMDSVLNQATAVAEAISEKKEEFTKDYSQEASAVEAQIAQLKQILEDYKKTLGKK